MALDGPTIASIIGSLFVLVGTVVGIWVADRRAKRKEAAEVRAARAAERVHEAELRAAEQARADAASAAEKTEVQNRSDELMRYIDTKVAEATKDLRDELSQVKRLVGSIYGRLSRTREAFRAYIWQVRQQWGKTDAPPDVGSTTWDLLGEDDLDDTFTAAQIAEITDPDHVGGEHPNT